MKYFWLLTLLALPLIIATFSNGNKYMAFAEDEIDDDVDVETDDVTGPDSEDSATDSEDDTTFKKSPDADTYLLFTKPLYTPGAQFELPGGLPVEFLVGFMNGGKNKFVVESVEASFRYPMDFNYYIQNFSAVPYNREVLSGNEATLLYSFLPSDSFAGRPFGLNIALNYRDENGLHYSESVFNETVQITELDEGLDGETFFLYVFLAGLVILLLVVGQRYLIGRVGKRSRSHTHHKVIETGTTNSSDVDYEFLPKEYLKQLQQSPKGKLSPKNSPNGKLAKSPKKPQSPKAKKA